MNRKYEVLIHVAIWAMLLLSPLMFVNHSDGQHLRLMAAMSASTLSLMAVFYADYCWLTPRFYVKGEKKYFWIINIIMVLTLGIAVHLWISYCRNFFDDESRNQQYNLLTEAFFILRNIFNLCVAAAVATSIQLAIRWQKSEAARREAETARMDAELQNLRSQINPHFLLNTLNNIYALTAFDATRAQEAIQELSRMLRHVLYDTQQQEVTLRDEVDFLDNYIKLMKIRMTDNVSIDFMTEGNLEHYSIAPMILISLVENAFKHGVSPIEPSFIHIHIRAAANIITCNIDNSNYPKPETDRSGHGIGLQQVKRRLELIYPNRYSWHKGVSGDGKTYSSELIIKN